MHQSEELDQLSTEIKTLWGRVKAGNLPDRQLSQYEKIVGMICKLKDSESKAIIADVEKAKASIASGNLELEIATAISMLVKQIGPDAVKSLASDSEKVLIKTSMQ